MATVQEARAPKRAIEVYCEATSMYAWPLYDLDPAPMTLSGADLVATALLSYPVRGEVLAEMNGGRGPFGRLSEAMREFVAIPPGQRFESIEASRVEGLASRSRFEDAGDDAFAALVRVLDAVQECDQLTSVYATKVLHRKRPLLVPLIDSRVRAYYGVGQSGYPEAMTAIRSDLGSSLEFLSQVSADAGFPDLPPLRALDIIIWMQGEDLDWAERLTTPNDLAIELGVSPKTLRGWLRREIPRSASDKGRRWLLGDEEVELAREHFR